MAVMARLNKRVTEVTEDFEVEMWKASLSKRPDGMILSFSYGVGQDEVYQDDEVTTFLDLMREVIAFADESESLAIPVTELPKFRYQLPYTGGIQGTTSFSQDNLANRLFVDDITFLDPSLRGYGLPEAARLTQGMTVNDDEELEPDLLTEDLLTEDLLIDTNLFKEFYTSPRTGQRYSREQLLELLYKVKLGSNGEWPKQKTEEEPNVYGGWAERFCNLAKQLDLPSTKTYRSFFGSANNARSLAEALALDSDLKELNTALLDLDINLDWSN